MQVVERAEFLNALTVEEPFEGHDLVLDRGHLVPAFEGDDAHFQPVLQHDVEVSFPQHLVGGAVVVPVDHDHLHLAVALQ